MIFLAIITLFPAVMIYLSINGIDTGEAFQKLLGFITIGAIVVAVVAFVAAILIRLFKLLFGK